MNRQQLIVLWIMGGLICWVMLSAPKYALAPLTPGASLVKIPTNQRPNLTPFIDWSVVAQRSIPILLIGGLLVLTLRGIRRELTELEKRQRQIRVNWGLLVLLFTVASYPLVLAYQETSYFSLQKGLGTVASFVVMIVLASLLLGTSYLMSLGTRADRVKHWRVALSISILVGVLIDLWLGKDLAQFYIGVAWRP